MIVSQLISPDDHHVNQQPTFPPTELCITGSSAGKVWHLECFLHGEDSPPKTLTPYCMHFHRVFPTHVLGFNRQALGLVEKKLNVNQLRQFPDCLCFVCVLRACLNQVHSGCCHSQPQPPLSCGFHPLAGPDLRFSPCHARNGLSFQAFLPTWHLAWVLFSLGPPTLGNGSQHHASFCSPGSVLAMPMTQVLSW